jgi:hypothetical protein
VAEAEARLWSPEGAAALGYLRGRGLHNATVRAARLGWTPRAEGVPWRPSGVVIPWFAAGALALVKVRPDDAWRARFPEDRRPPKYLEAHRDPARFTGIYPGPEVIRAGRPLIIAEGELDRLLLAQELGEAAAVATLGSASARPEGGVLAAFLAAWPWYVATDADVAGEGAADAWPKSARRVRPPGTFKDWTEAWAGGVDLRRWWGDVLAGDPLPPPFSWEQLAAWRWRPAAGDPDPGVVVDRPDRTRMLAALRAAAADPDENALAERAAMRDEGDGWLR